MRFLVIDMSLAEMNSLTKKKTKQKNKLSIDLLWMPAATARFHCQLI